jgi:hypothetical protein
MNLFKFHSEPKTLAHYDLAPELVPKLFSPLGNVGIFPGKLTQRQINAISKDTWQAYSYARGELKKRWPEAEPYIMKDPEIACAYAIDIIGEPWPEAEEVIRLDYDAWQEYEDYFGL